MPTFQHDNPDIAEDSGNNLSIDATSSEKL